VRLSRRRRRMVVVILREAGMRKEEGTQKFF